MAEYRYTSSDLEYTVQIARSGANTWRAVIEGREYDLSLDDRQATRLDVRIDGRGYHCHVDPQGDDRFISWRGNSYILRRIDHQTVGNRSSSAHTGASDPEIRAPMPGKVIKIHVEVGDQIEKNAPVVVLEAMKMEYSLVAPLAGKLERILCNVGDRVELGSVLAVMQIPVEVVDE